MRSNGMVVIVVGGTNRSFTAPLGRKLHKKLMANLGLPFSKINKV